jgi:hypothetical protein
LLFFFSFINDFIGDNHDGNDSGSVNLSVLDELISEIRTRTSRREQQSSSQIMQSLTEKRLAQDDPGKLQDIYKKRWKKNK